MNIIYNIFLSIDSTYKKCLLLNLIYYRTIQKSHLLVDEQSISVPKTFINSYKQLYRI